jgi:hypothetical protein
MWSWHLEDSLRVASDHFLASVRFIINFALLTMIILQQKNMTGLRSIDHQIQIIKKSLTMGLSYDNINIYRRLTHL